MKLFYWSPFLSNIATIDSVINSINSLKKYGKDGKYKTFIIDSTGEWQEKMEKISESILLNCIKKIITKLYPKAIS